ncbi:helix-turn-helix domain-containing protein [Actinocrinis puniceicyclus]|uniref:helix-turn-helix domain-containing protein n=1 Tax=Actinocrinis puniceicyclus TaxID=977794 RepID=UPI001B8C5966|nr:helix-turn-helix transcriptional regulator [Actinocrinis puniceicyclus]
MRVARGMVWFDGSALRAARLRAGNEAGWSLDELVRRLRAAGWAGATRQTLIGYENGTSVPEPARLRVLAMALGTTPAALSGVAGERARLADLRHWAGLTANQAAGSFGFSRWSLLRVERLGQLPRGWAESHEGEDGFVQRAALAYGTTPQVVDAAWTAVLRSTER